jgi:hypothetical protein
MAEIIILKKLISDTVVYHYCLYNMKIKLKKNKFSEMDQK